MTGNIIGSFRHKHTWLSPIKQQKYLGGEAFIGNPNLLMSSLRNYVLRMDYKPYESGLFPASYFVKNITDLIEYVQRRIDFAYITPGNYLKGQITGFEIETRHNVGGFWKVMEGFTFGDDAKVILERKYFSGRILIPKMRYLLSFNAVLLWLKIYTIIRKEKINLSLPMNMKNIAVLLITIKIIASIAFGAVHNSSHNAGRKEFKTGQVSLTVELESNIYTYRLLNLAPEEIVGIEIPQHASYNFKAPESWQIEETDESFRAWTDNNYDAITPNFAAEFSMRVSSAGAVLGKKPVKIYFKSGKVINVSDVWVPVAEPRSYVFWVSGIIFAILILHTIVVIRKKQKKDKSSVNSV